MNNTAKIAYVSLWTVDDDGWLRSPAGTKVARCDHEMHAIMLYDKRTRTSFPLTLLDLIALLLPPLTTIPDP